MQQLQPVIAQDIEITRSKTITVFALSAYKDPLSKLIRAKNYHDYIAAVYIGRLMGAFMQQQERAYDYIVPVPLHWTRRVWRGYNQAEVIAREISALVHKPVINGVYRKKRTVLQAALSRIARSDNVSDAFALEQAAACFTGKKLLIVDDLLTSGATIRAVSKTLLQAKPSDLIAFVAARVIQ